MLGSGLPSKIFVKARDFKPTRTWLKLQVSSVEGLHEFSATCGAKIIVTVDECYFVIFAPEKLTGYTLI